MSSEKKTAPRRESQKAAAVRLSEALGRAVTAQNVRRWREKGWDLNDIPKLEKLVANMERPPKRTTENPEEPDVAAEARKDLDERVRDLEGKLLLAANYETARTIRTQIAGMKDLVKVQVERGKYMLKTDAEAAGMQFAQHVKHGWEKIEDSLPPMLEGLSAAQMKEKLREFARMQLLELHEFAKQI